jgi:hypothetical protein
VTPNLTSDAEAHPGKQNSSEHRAKTLERSSDEQRSVQAGLGGPTTKMPRDPLAIVVDSACGDVG